MQCMTNFLEHMKVLSSIAGLSMWQKLYPYVLFSDSFEGDVGRDQDNETAVVTHHDAMIKSLLLTAYCYQVVRKYFFLTLMLLHLQMRKTLGTNFLTSKIFHLMDHIVPYSSLCCHFYDFHMSFFSDELICFFPLYLSVQPVC